jgi:hypothetical protein
MPPVRSTRCHDPGPDMKKVLAIVAVLLVLPGVGGLWSLRARKADQQQCLNYMRQLDGAAVSFCLEQRLSPTSVLSVATLSPYLRSGTICPGGRSDYPSFSVLNGPVCPNGHPFLEGLPRPLRAASSDYKVAGLYLANGFTNLIDGPKPTGTANGGHPAGSEPNSAPGTGSRR